VCGLDDFKRHGKESTSCLFRHSGRVTCFGERMIEHQPQLPKNELHSCGTQPLDWHIHITMLQVPVLHSLFDCIDDFSYIIGADLWVTNVIKVADIVVEILVLSCTVQVKPSPSKRIWNLYTLFNSNLARLNITFWTAPSRSRQAKSIPQPCNGDRI
jgi:hypothetical protein